MSPGTKAEAPSQKLRETRRKNRVIAPGWKEDGRGEMGYGKANLRVNAVGNGPGDIGWGGVKLPLEDDGVLNGVHVGCIVTCRREIDHVRY